MRGWSMVGELRDSSDPGALDRHSTAALAGFAVARTCRQRRVPQDASDEPGRASARGWRCSEEATRDSLRLKRQYIMGKTLACHLGYQT